MRGTSHFLLLVIMNSKSLRYLGYRPGIVMELKPTVALRAFLAGGIAIFAKVGGAMKAAGSAKVGAAAAAAAAATAAISGTKREEKDTNKEATK